MCGLAGYLGSKQIDAERIELCLESMQHRGPDHKAFFHQTLKSGRELYLLHSRLSIIDLDERAHQPFVMDENVLTHNGEIYNYVELREQLLKEGHAFKTDSDTEVLATLLKEKKEKALDFCEGMWAFAWFEKSEESVYLSRDRFGEKPLYILRRDDGIYFGSEIKFIKNLLEENLKVNQTQLYRYLVNGYKSLYKAPETFYQGITQIAPGTLLKIDDQGYESEIIYWQPQISFQEEIGFKEAVACARSKLLRAIEIRLRADVPLAFCLSGGIDSNALVAIAKKEFNYDVHGFTIVNEDERYEEKDMVQLALDDYQIEHTAIPVDTKNFLEKLRNQIRNHDMPISTITYHAQWRLMESIAQQGYRVSVSGTGADELFSGYYDHHLAYLYEIRNEQGLFAEAIQNWEQFVRPVVRNPHLQNFDLFIKNRNHREHIFLNSLEFSDFLTEKWFEDFREEKYSEDLLRNRMLNELFHESVPVILNEDDLNAMSYSIENRSPFLDRDLFESVYSIPTRHLVKKGRAKAILREVCRKYVPEAIVDNPRKVGFNAPLYSYLDIQNTAIFNEVLSESPIFEYVKKDKIREMFSKMNLLNSESKFLFNFVNAKIFLEENL